MSGYDDTAAALFDYHHSMLVDRERTEAFLVALMAEVRPGDVVVDIGAGTGVLSMFAAMAGARHVYAVEEGPISAVAERAIADNGFAERISLIRGRSTEVQIPERGNVLVTETIGNVGLEEGITAWVRDARDRLLLPDARVIPRNLGVVAAPVEVPFEHGELSRWKLRRYEIDLTALGDLGSRSLLWAELTPHNLLADPYQIIGVDLESSPAPSVAGGRSFEARRSGQLHGIGLWFTAELIPGRWLTNAPPLRTPSWNHGYLALPDAVDVAEGAIVDITVESINDGGMWTWTVSLNGSVLDSVTTSHLG